MAMPIYTDGCAQVEARGDILFVTLKSGGEAVRIAMTHHAALSLAEGVRVARLKKFHAAEVAHIEDEVAAVS